MALFRDLSDTMSLRQQVDPFAQGMRGVYSTTFLVGSQALGEISHANAILFLVLWSLHLPIRRSSLCRVCDTIRVKVRTGGLL